MKRALSSIFSIRRFADACQPRLRRSPPALTTGPGHWVCPRPVYVYSYTLTLCTSTVNRLPARGLQSLDVGLLTQRLESYFGRHDQLGKCDRACIPCIQSRLSTDAARWRVLFIFAGGWEGVGSLTLSSARLAAAGSLTIERPG